MEEEYRILENSVKDFNSKYLDNIVLKIEKEGIPEQVRKAMLEQGFLGMVQLLDGNKVMDKKALSIIIEVLSTSSPSVAMEVFLTNVLFHKLADEQSINEVSQGIKRGTVAFAELMSGYDNENELHMEGEKLIGTKKYVLNSDADLIIASATDGNLYIIKSGFKEIETHRKLGFRGLKFGKVEFNTKDYVKIGRKEDLVKAYEEAHPFITALAIGIAEGSLMKAIEYSKVRSAFGNLLKDFQPIAFPISMQYNELSMLKNSLYLALSNESETADILFLKMKSIELAKEITKNSIQVHGGYGYIEDYGVEKFYRDIMSLSVLLYNEEEEKKKLASKLYETEAGYI